MQKKGLNYVGLRRIQLTLNSGTCRLCKLGNSCTFWASDSSSQNRNTELHTHMLWGSKVMTYLNLFAHCKTECTHRIIVCIINKVKILGLLNWIVVRLWSIKALTRLKYVTIFIGKADWIPHTPKIIFWPFLMSRYALINCLHFTWGNYLIFLSILSLVFLDINFFRTNTILVISLEPELHSTKKACSENFIEGDDDYY